MAAPNKPFELADTTPRSSKTTLNIAGFWVYLYGVDDLTPDEARDTIVLFHIHGRTRTYSDAEQLAHELLCRVKRGGTRRGLVVATFDNRNHGLRAIDNIAIQDWKGGNAKHGQDMLSMIDGIAADVQIVQKYLETYVDGQFVPREFIVTGLSLGGHATWNILAEDPRITRAIIIVGSSNLTNLLLERLGDYNSAADVPDGTREWPPALEKLYQARDDAVSRISGKTILILNGLLDTLVQSRFTHLWMEKHAANNDVRFIEQEENGHWLSYGMMDEIVNWLLPILDPGVVPSLPAGRS